MLKECTSGVETHNFDEMKRRYLTFARFFLHSNTLLKNVNSEVKLPYQNMSFCKDFKDNSLIRSHNWGEVSILAPHLAVRCLIWTATATWDLRALQSQATQDRPIRIWRFSIRESVKPPPFLVSFLWEFAKVLHCLRLQQIPTQWGHFQKST